MIIKQKIEQSSTQSDYYKVQFSLSLFPMLVFSTFGALIYYTGASVSIQITVDPIHPRALPECKFLGSDQGKFSVLNIGNYWITQNIIH